MRSPLGTLSIMYGLDAALYFCMPNGKKEERKKKLVKQLLQILTTDTSNHWPRPQLIECSNLLSNGKNHVPVS